MFDIKKSRSTDAMKDQDLRYGTPGLVPDLISDRLGL